MITFHLKIIARLFSVAMLMLKVENIQLPGTKTEFIFIIA